MRVFIASLACETNTFAPFPTGLAAFEENGLTKAASRTNEGMGAAALSVFRALAEQDGFEVFESLTAYAQPAGRTLRTVYERLRDEILEDLARAGPVDLVLLLLHGAMVADAYDDCEGDILERVRAIAPKAVIGLEIDPHCHLTRRMVETADLVVIFKEYPHVDVSERAADLYRFCVDRLRGRIAPVAAMIDVRMVGLYPTTAEPMRGIVRGLEALERSGAVLSASIAHGFPWGDVADVGTRVLVYTDGAPKAAAERAMGVAKLLYEAREQLSPALPDIAQSLDRAARLDGLVVLGDHSDNPGGGAPGDSTFFLREILARGLRDVALGPIWDPVIASVCCDAGAGAKLSVRLGGKMGPTSGDPIDLAVEVLGVNRAHAQTAFGTMEPMGPCAAIRAGGVDIVVVSHRAQAYGLDLFEGLGVSLQDKKLVVVKSSRHYEHAFGKIAAHLWSVSSPGALTSDFGAIPYTKRDGDFFPRLPDPWNAAGVPQPLIFERSAR